MARILHDQSRSLVRCRRHRTHYSAKKKSAMVTLLPYLCTGSDVGWHQAALYIHNALQRQGSDKLDHSEEGRHKVRQQLRPICTWAIDTCVELVDAGAATLCL